MNRLKNFIFEKIFKLSSNFRFKKMLKRVYVAKLAKFFYCKIFRNINRRCSYVIDGIDAQFCADRDEDFKYIMTNGNMEYKILNKILKILVSGEIVFDVGASMGLYTIFLAKKVGKSGRVISIEPDKERFKILCKNIQANSLKNTIPFQLALGDIEKEAVLTSRLSGADLTVEPISAYVSLEDQIINVISGDSLIREKGLPLPNAIKIDVEGYEYFVIKGLKKTLKEPSCRLVCCEIHHNQLPPGVTMSTIIDLLNDFGFLKIETYPTYPHRNTTHILCHKIGYKENENG